MLSDLRDEVEAEPEEPMLDAAGNPMLDEAGNPMLMPSASEAGDRLKALLEQGEDSLVGLDELPEVERYIGFTFQQVDPEDMRWDWNIRRPEDLRYVRWMAQRVWMTEADIREKWPHIKPGDLQMAFRVEQEGMKTVIRDSSDEDDEYGGKDPEEENHGDGQVDDEVRRGRSLAVWEYWDGVQGSVYRWVAGTSKMLDVFVPSAAPSRFFPFFFFSFSRVTGKLFGPSDTDLQEPLQDESNRIRTWKREAMKSAHPRFMVSRGLLRPSEKAKFAEALPYSLTEVERADDVAKGVFPIVPPIYNPQLYDRTDCVVEMQQMAGISGAAAGGSLPGTTATADAIANQSMSGQMSYRQKQIRKLYTDVYQAMAEVNAQILPEENAKAIAGPGAVMPPIDRQQILAGFVFDVEAVTDDLQERASEMKGWLELSQIAKQLGFPLNSIPVMKRLLLLMGVRDNIGDYVSVPMLMATMGVPQGGPAGASGPSNLEDRPEAQGDEGAAGGSPGGGFTAPPGPESIPNSPA
jgi:hypothetical protein